MITLTFSNLTDEAIDAACIERLESRGYVCEIPMDWKPLGQCARELGISTKTLIKRLNDPRSPLPKNCVMRTGGGADGRGRRSHLAMTLAFQKFCKEPRA